VALREREREAGTDEAGTAGHENAMRRDAQLPISGSRPNA
jgi:hypothetical protein